MNLLIYPLFIPFFTASICFLLWNSPHLQKVVSYIGSLATFASAIAILTAVIKDGTLVLYVGNWQAPFGITLVADTLSALMVMVTAVIGLGVHTYSLFTSNEDIERYGYHPLYQTLLMGVYGSFITGDVFNMYVCFEIMLISSFVLLALGNRRAQIEGALKYMALNLFGSFLFLAGAGILYGLTGTLNLADLAIKMQAIEHPGLASSVAILFIVAFGLKSAAFPFFSWLPASYHTPPSAVSAIFAGLLTKVGVYAMIRFFSLVFTQNISFTHELILILSLFTMVCGVYGAVGQNDIRKILSFHIISQIGYMLLGLGMWTSLAITGAIFYLIHHIIVKANLFLIAGVIHRITGSYHLNRMGGLYKSHAILAILFLIPALSLAGIPPLSGFFAKVLLIKAGLIAERPFSVFIMIIVGAFTLISMTKIFDKAFWKPASKDFELHPLEGAERTQTITGMLIPIAALAMITIALGLGSPYLFQLSKVAAFEVMNPEVYIQAVFGSGD